MLGSSEAGNVGSEGDKSSDKGFWERAEAKSFLFRSRATKYAYAIWYIVVCVPLTVFVFLNWYEVKEFTFFDKFNGPNLLFLVWLLIIILPLIGKLEVFGLKYEASSNNPLGPNADDDIGRLSNETAPRGGQPLSHGKIDTSGGLQ